MLVMSWGADLWDQFDRIADHTQKGIDFCERYNEFVKERCKVEASYAKELRRLIKSYQPKKKEDEDGFSCTRGFFDMLKEVGDIAGQHDAITEGLQQGVVKSLQTLVVQLKAERKRNLEEGKRLQTQLEAQHLALQKAKKKYEITFRDAEKAEEMYRRADDDIHLSRAEVEKARMTSIQKSQICNSCKGEYAAVLEKTNHFQRDYYGRMLPQVYEQLQQLDEHRVETVKQQLLECVKCEKSVLPIIGLCLDAVAKAADGIVPSEDSKVVIEKYKSGHSPPSDVPFEDLSNENGDVPAPNMAGSSTLPAATTGSKDGDTPKCKADSAATAPKSSTLRGGSSSDKRKERSGISRLFTKPKHRTLSFRLPEASTGFRPSPRLWSKSSCPDGTRTSEGDEPREDFGHLPPQQQKKQLIKKIKEIQHQVAKENSEREGMMKMLDVYASNPSLGDPRLLDRELEENRLKLEALHIELRKYEEYLEQADHVTNGGTPGLQRRNSGGSYQSTGSSGGAGGAGDGGASKPLDYDLAAAASGQPMLSGGSHESFGGQQQQLGSAAAAAASGPGLQYVVASHGASGNEDSFDEMESFASPGVKIGTATARYPFEPTSDGSISMHTDEMFSILEPDQGDGWTRVRRTTNNEEGFVPTSYITTVYY